MNKTFNYKIIYSLFFLIVSILISNQYLNKFEKNLFKVGNYEFSSIYQTDSIFYIEEAEKIRTDINSGKKFLESGGAYYFSYLYPKIIFFFNKIVNKDISLIDKNKIDFKNYKIFIFFQITIFFISLITLYKALSKNMEKRLVIILVSVIFLNPIIFQWHMSFLTESLFLSFLIFSISLLLSSKNYFHFFLLGILIGILYMLRTIALLYPIIFIFYLFIQRKNINQKILNCFSVLTGLILILLFIGTNNYLRAQVFYFTPMQTKSDLNTYIEAAILIKSKNFDAFQAREHINEKTEKILDDEKLDLSNERDKLFFLKKVQRNSIKTIFDNKIAFLEIISKNYFHSLLLNPTQVYFAAKYQYWQELKNSYDHKHWLKIRIIITLLFFTLSLFGFIISIKKISFDLNIFLFFSILYFFFTSCWLGNTRYFVPSVLFMGVYLSLALDKIYEKINIKIESNYNK